MRKKAPLIILISLVVIVGIILSYLAVKAHIENNLVKLQNMPVPDIDMSMIGDGTHYGKYSSFPVTVEVLVYVSSHKITGIDILRHNSRNKDAERITEDVVDLQSVKVDTVSGATYSSEIILKAIEDALVKDDGGKLIN